MRLFGYYRRFVKKFAGKSEILSEFLGTMKQKQAILYGMKDTKSF